MKKRPRKQRVTALVFRLAALQKKRPNKQRAQRLEHMISKLGY
jgi:hypothetical protein